MADNDPTDSGSRAIFNLQKDLEDLQREQQKLAEQQKALDQDSIKAQEKKLEILENIVEQRQVELSLQRQKKQDDQEQIVRLEKAKKEQTALNELIQKQQEIQEDILDISRSFSSEINIALGMVDDINETGFARMSKLIKESGGYMNALNNAALETSKNLKARLFDSMIKKGQEMFVLFFEQLDEVSSNLEKAIPNGRKYASMVEDITSSQNSALASMEDVGKSIISLNDNFADFQKIGDKQQRQLVELSTTLEQIGVSTDDFAKNTNLLVKSLGMNTDEILGFQDQLNDLASLTHKSIGTLNKDFEQTGKRLAVFGKSGAVKVFKDLEKASKVLGIEMNRLLDISEGFDTFESAAEAAGSLNSVLGGNLINTIDLMNASLDDPIEVFKLFKTSLDKTGKSVDQMTNAQKKMIAETMHLDVSELESLSKLDLNTAIDQLEGSAAETKSFNEQAKLAQPILQELQKTMYKLLSVMAPIVHYFKEFVDWLADAVATNKYFIKNIGQIVVMAGGASLAIRAIGHSIVFLKAITMSFGKAGVLGSLLGKVSPAAAPSMLTNIGQAASVGAKGFLSLGAAALGLGVGIGAAAWGMSKFVEAFHGMSPSEIQTVTIAIGVFSAGLVLMVFALSKIADTAGRAGIELLPLGAAIALIGAGIGVAAWGMSKLVESFTDFMRVADLGKLANLYLGINMLSQSFAMLSASFIALGLASPNLLVFGLAVKVSLTDAVIEKLQKVADYMTMISTSLENMKVEKLTALATAATMAASIQTGEINTRLSATADESRGYGGGVGEQVMVQIPEQTIKVEIKAPIMLDGVKMGDFIQEQIVKRENKLVPGSIQSSIGIKVGNYHD